MLKDTDENSIFESNMKPSLFKHWSSAYKESGGHTFHASKERMLFSRFNSYRDVLNCDKKPFYLKGQREDSSTMNAYIMHSLNHIFKTRDFVTKNDSKLSKNQESIEEDLLHNNEMFLDQGFARSKVLILLPLRSIAYRVVRRLIQLVPSSHKVNVEHMARFMEDFGGGADENEDPDKVIVIELSHCVSIGAIIRLFDEIRLASILLLSRRVSIYPNFLDKYILAQVFWIFGF
ncbi:hypothetical protein MLD38_000036 [Melastoma candidum]|uniref:Uncharacterized protein n=1 Tax=Melastoma candidum TaxID=119954 RepID=A0ACB9S820_9MYRT|nr:hypothetical protein MLD38_000036 [Melastoma candidum]